MNMNKTQTKPVIARPSTSLIARKAAGKMVVKTGLRAGAAAQEERRKLG
jgi:hypothetical protein